MTHILLHWRGLGLAALMGLFAFGAGPALAFQDDDDNRRSRAERGDRDRGDRGARERRRDEGQRERGRRSGDRRPIANPEDRARDHRGRPRHTEHGRLAGPQMRRPSASGEPYKGVDAGRGGGWRDDRRPVHEPRGPGQRDRRVDEPRGRGPGEDARRRPRDGEQTRPRRDRDREFQRDRSRDRDRDVRGGRDRDRDRDRRVRRERDRDRDYRPPRSDRDPPRHRVRERERGFHDDRRAPPPRARHRDRDRGHARHRSGHREFHRHRRYYDRPARRHYLYRHHRHPSSVKWGRHYRSSRIIIAPRIVLRSRGYYHVPPRRRWVVSGVTVVRDYGPLYYGYGGYYAETDAWRWVGLTAVTLDIARYMSEAQLRAHEDALIRATRAEPGDLLRWFVGDASGEVKVVRLGEDEFGRPCREIYQDIIVGGRNAYSTFTACRSANGAWLAY